MPKLCIHNLSVWITMLAYDRTWHQTPYYLSTKCLRNIMKIFWTRRFSNKQMLRIIRQNNMKNKFITRRWRLISHILWTKDDSISKGALISTPEGKKKTRTTETNKEKDCRKITQRTTCKLVPNYKDSCIQEKVEDPCFHPMCQWAIKRRKVYKHNAYIFQCVVYVRQRQMSNVYLVTPTFLFSWFSWHI